MEAYDILTAIEKGVPQAVLATVIHVEGHAYRKQGTMMLLTEDGQSAGSISPGCLEADLAEYVPSVWKSQKPQLVEYDMRPADDFGWGDTIGCGGLIRILLEPVAGELLVNMRTIKAALDLGLSLLLTRLYSAVDATVDYSLQEACMGAEAEWADASMSARREPSTAVYVSLFEPKPRVIVFGANQDAIPLVQLALSAGFRVVVADWREALCTADRFPGAELTAAFPDQLKERLNLTSGDYVIVMSHQFQKDRDFVQEIMAAPLRYLGIMGTRARTEKLLDGRDVPAWLHYPVGFKIGSEGPVENAVSIVAELISIRRGMAGGKKAGYGWNPGDLNRRSNW
ncbi:XdhC family protein [Paenibacillus aestuarii]|uniref:XdhC family protein n=1 Tax=Paenibacillus aestuarii TaxID=516965 RepID=A0ABW0KHK1_9BACL|nr:XdhC/CoxI family protein [Paenibacillus aestuarii]